MIFFICTHLQKLIYHCVKFLTVKIYYKNVFRIRAFLTLFVDFNFMFSLTKTLFVNNVFVWSSQLFVFSIRKNVKLLDFN